jgi:hypothetical protein
MKTLMLLAITALTFSGLARADSFKLDDDDRSQGWSKHYNSDSINVGDIKLNERGHDDLDDFTWNHKDDTDFDHATSPSSTTWSDSASGPECNRWKSQDNDNPLPTPTPEPRTWLLMGTGLLIGAAMLRKQSLGLTLAQSDCDKKGSELI